jgi:gluconate 2-dehydrogenase alpha chain
MYESNFLDLDPVARDRSDLGLPVIRITFQQYRNELAVIEYVRKKSVDLLKKMGVEKIWMGPTLSGVGSSHDLGGLRIGDDATNSVVDADLMTHEVPNLYERRGFSIVSRINPRR